MPHRRTDEAGQEASDHTGEVDRAPVAPRVHRRSSAYTVAKASTGKVSNFAFSLHLSASRNEERSHEVGRAVADT